MSHEINPNMAGYMIGGVRGNKANRNIIVK
jgi:hypothetical protein